MHRTRGMKRWPMILIALLLFSPSGPQAFAAPPAAKNLPPTEALNELKLGNQRFVAGKARSCANANAARAELTESQAPNAIVLSCSDSRVPPEQVFDQGLGKIFTARVAGNILNDDEVASFEYAVSKLGARLIVVLGHESCGAIQAAIETRGGKDAGSPSLNQLVSEIRSNLGTAPIPAAGTLREPVKRNVSAVAGELPRRSKMIHDAVASGKVRIIRAIYDLETGKVDFWD